MLVKGKRVRRVHELVNKNKHCPSIKRTTCWPFDRLEKDAKNKSKQVNVPLSCC